MSDLVEQFKTNIGDYHSLIDRLIAAQVLSSNTAEGMRADSQRSPNQTYSRVRRFLSWLKTCNKENCYQTFTDQLRAGNFRELADKLDSYTPIPHDSPVR